MFEIGWSELLVIAVVAIVVIGPKDLPRVMRMVGQWTGKMKRMGREFQSQFNEALREAELEDVRKGVEDLSKLNPLNSVREQLTKTGEDIRKGMDVGPPPSTAGASSEPAPAAEPPPPAEMPAPVQEPVAAASVDRPAEPAPAAVGEVKP